MIKKIIPMLLLLPISVFGAENQGIESANYETSIDFSNSKYRDAYALSAVANLPIDKKFAANLMARYSDSNGKSFSGGRGFDSTSSSLFAMLFIRDQTTGKAGAALAYTKSEHDYPASLSSFKNQETKGYSIYGQFYLDNLTLFAARAYSENNNDFSRYTSNAGLAIYLPANTGISLAGLRANQETDYSLAITHQPSFLNNNAGVTFSYIRDSDNSDFDSISLSFSYYFGTRASLIDRDRKYR